MPWCPVPDHDVLIGTSHTAPRLADDRSSVTIDPGACTNLMVEKLPRSFAKRVLDVGHRPAQEKHPTPLRNQGAGNGHQDCE